MNETMQRCLQSIPMSALVVKCHKFIDFIELEYRYTSVSSSSIYI